MFYVFFSFFLMHRIQFLVVLQLYLIYLQFSSCFYSPPPQLDFLTLEADAITSLTYVFIIRVFGRPCIHTCALILHMMVHLCVVAVFMWHTTHHHYFTQTHTGTTYRFLLGGWDNKVLSESSEVNLFRFHFGLNLLYLIFFLNFCPSSPRSCDPDRL